MTDLYFYTLLLHNFLKKLRLELFRKRSSIQLSFPHRVSNSQTQVVFFPLLRTDQSLVSILNMMVLVSRCRRLIRVQQLTFEQILFPNFLKRSRLGHSEGLILAAQPRKGVTTTSSEDFINCAYYHYPLNIEKFITQRRPARKSTISTIRLPS